MAENVFLGVYSTTTKESSGPGQNQVIRKRYWFVWRDGGHYSTQMLSQRFEPISDRVPLSHEEFLGFHEEPDIAVRPKDAPPKSPNEPQRVTPDVPAKHTPSQPQVYDISVVRDAVKLDHFLRSEFAMALARMKRKDSNVTLDFLEKFAEEQEGILPVHKHMFTDFGMDLRRSRLPLLAIKFYKRALELSPGDCNAHFNIARAYYELGDIAACRESLLQALDLEPGFHHALDFLQYIEYKHGAQLKTAAYKNERKKLRS